MLHKSTKFISALFLVFSTGATMASPVSITANFSSFSVDSFWSYMDPTVGSIINGQLLSRDPVIPNNPVSIQTSGNVVQFGIDSDFGRLPLFQNSISFVGSSNVNVAGVGVENSFKLGTLTFKNGSFQPLAFLTFSLTTNSSDSNYNNFTFNGKIRVDTNNATYDANNVPDYYAGADYITFADASGATISNIGSFRVFDSDQCPANLNIAVCDGVGSVDVYGYINSLHLAHLGNPSAGAFLNPSINSNIAPVPEPGIPAMLLLGGALLAYRVRGLAKSKSSG